MNVVDTKMLRDERGSAMIELSIILPVLVLMLLGVVDLGIILRQNMIVADSARAGAEYSMNWATAGNTAGMQAVAVASAGSIPGYAAVATVACTCGVGGAAVACTGTCAGSVSPAQYAQVTATASLPVLYSVAGLPASINVKSVARVRVPWTAGQ